MGTPRHRKVKYFSQVLKFTINGSSISIKSVCSRFQALNPMLYKRMESTVVSHKKTVDGVVREALFEVMIFEQNFKYIKKE